MTYYGKKMKKRPIKKEKRKSKLEEERLEGPRERGREGGRTRERHLLQCQKRPVTVSKETYYSVKRGLLQTYYREREGGGRTRARAHTHTHTHKCLRRLESMRQRHILTIMCC